MTSWILEVVPSNLGLKVNLASISEPLAEKSRLNLGCFLEWKCTISVLQTAPERHARPLMLSVCICMWTACRPFYEDRWISGLREEQPDLNTWTTYPYSPQNLKNQNKMNISRRNFRQIMCKYNIWKNGTFKASPISQVGNQEWNESINITLKWQQKIRCSCLWH